MKTQRRKEKLDSDPAYKAVVYAANNARSTKRYKNDPIYKQRQRSLYLRRYWPGTSAEEAQLRYDTLFNAQNGKCAICKNPEIAMDKRNGKIRDLSVDHDHSTGVVRGLLCHNCNRGLGYLKDNLTVLQNAISYLNTKA